MELWEEKAKPNNIPLIVFNGTLGLTFPADNVYCASASPLRVNGFSESNLHSIPPHCQGSLTLFEEGTTQHSSLRPWQKSPTE